MISLQYHKGQRCVCSTVFCQEGYCSECEIHSRFTNNLESVSREESVSVRGKTGVRHMELVSTRK
jgi:hypothetical protein